MRCLALALVLSVLLQCGVFAAVSAQPAPDTAEIINGLPIPDTWAHDALVFAVENGILRGKDGTDLCPEDSATRAEMATMMVRIFSATKQADLTAYTDCIAGKWYYDTMAAAVELGFFNGTSLVTLSPNTPITREQAFTVIARAFLMEDGSAAALKRFSDAGKVSNFATGAMAAMVEAGYVNGSGGMLRPKANISRQELAQVLYKVITAIVRDGGEPAESYRNLLYSAAAPLPEGTVIHGDLTITCAAGDELLLRGITVEGRLIVRSEAPRTITLENCQIGTLCIVGDATLCAGQVDKLLLYAGDLTICEGVSVGELTVAPKAAGAVITVDGTVDAATLDAWNLTLWGDGAVGTVTLLHPDYQISCQYGELVNQIDGGILALTATPDAVGNLTASDAETTFRVKFTDVDIFQVYGVPEGGRKCTLQWYVDGKLIHTQKNFRMTEGAEVSCTYFVNFYYGMPEAHKTVLRVLYRQEQLDVEIPFTVTPPSSAYDEAKTIKTIHVEGYVQRSSPLYRTSSLSSTTGRSVKAGDIVYFLGFGSANWVELPDGTRGYLPAGTVNVSTKAYYNSKVQYSKAAKEAFVNELHTYDSSSQYLVWCNLYSQTVNIFQGSKGNWKLIKSTPCATGANTSPTRPGVYSIYSRTGRWDFDNNYYYVLYPSLFDGGCAFHTRTRLCSDDSWLDSRLGMTITHGCVRMPDEYALWIYQNCPIGTRVVVY